MIEALQTILDYLVYPFEYLVGIIRQLLSMVSMLASTLQLTSSMPTWMPTSIGAVVALGASLVILLRLVGR